MIPIVETICDQKSLSQPVLSPALSPGYAQSASPDDMSPMSTWTIIQRVAPRVTTVRTTQSDPMANRETTPSIPKIRASHGAIVISISLMFWGRWGALVNTSTSWFSSTHTCFVISLIWSMLEYRDSHYILSDPHYKDIYDNNERLLHHYSLYIIASSSSSTSSPTNPSCWRSTISLYSGESR